MFSGFKSDFSKNIFALIKGTTLSQAIPIMISPVLTRLFTPSEFGYYSLYISIVAFLTILSTARYEFAIVLPKDGKKAINILALSIMIATTVSLFVFVLLLFFKDEFLNFLDAKYLANVIYLLPISLFLAGVIQSLNLWFNRKKYFSHMAKAQIYQSLTIASSQLSFGFFQLTNGLIYGNLLGRFFALFVYLKKFLQKDVRYLVFVNKQMMISLMKRYKDFPLINSWHALSDVARTSGVVFLISLFFGSTVLGFFTLSIKVLQVPISVIGSALGQVLYQKFSQLNNSDRSLYLYVKSIVIKLSLLSCVLFFVLYFVAPYIFGLIFSKEWEEVGVYVQILIPYLFINFILSPISAIPIILEKQKEYFYISLFINLSLPFFIYLSYKNGFDILKTLYVYSYAGFLSYTCVLFWILYILKKKEAKV